MSKNKNSVNKTFENPVNDQEKLANIENCIQVNGSNINETHNSKKESLGSNNKR
ncbi:hypothetical protein [Clostridium sp.]|jgi:hypothetical protein|uniref:hypothetical protein n=1 Tax=Clostridium sp. TaxID=1506 RepID=UPI002FDD272F